MFLGFILRFLVFISLSLIFSVYWLVIDFLVYIFVFEFLGSLKLRSSIIHLFLGFIL